MSLRSILLIHISIIAISNVLVQYPFTIFGFHTTWGAFSYPIIFITTDLTVRILGKQVARRVVFFAMLPGLIISYILASMFDHNSDFIGIDGVLSFDIMAFRVATACFTAYVIGQLLDILIFQRFRENYSWWVAPSVASTIANIVDTIVFFSVAFYGCNVPILRDHWPEIAVIDFCFKYFISIVAFVPAYGFILKRILAKNERITATV